MHAIVNNRDSFCRCVWGEGTSVIYSTVLPIKLVLWLFIVTSHPFSPGEHFVAHSDGLWGLKTMSLKTSGIVRV